MSASSSREEIPRIALNSLDDWERIQQEFASTVQEVIDATLAGQESLSEEDKAALLKHLQKVIINILA
jgi:hypothetical protein